MSTYWVPLGTSSRVFYGTTPPTTPQDGDIWFFPADTTNGVVWQFRYNAGSASAYKWEFVGGPPMSNDVRGTDTSTTITTWVNLTTVGPRITVPRAGDYYVQAVATITLSVSTINAQAAVGYADFTNPLVRGIAGIYNAGAYTVISMSALLAGIAASSELRMKYWFGLAATFSAQERSITAVPVRVS